MDQIVMGRPQRYAIIVDPLSTAQAYAGAFSEAGMTPVAVLSAASPVEVYVPTWHPENFAHVHYFDGDVSALAATLREYEPECIVPGAETGVELYEQLAELVLPGSGNVPGLAAARRDKWAMARAVADAGIPHLRQLCSADLDEIEKWLHDTGLSGCKSVVKPPKSAGGDDVHVVAPGTDWRPLAESLLGRVNKAGLVNEAVLVQEFAEGSEFLVDTYSVDGRHGLVDVCRYLKITRGDQIGIYDRVDFLAPDHPDVATIWPYTQRVLDAVGIRNGCGHTEIMLTPDGPRLIELAERPAGGGHQMISEIATGDNHILRTVAHRACGEFKDGYRLITHLRGVLINAPHAGIWRNAEIFDNVDELPTFSSKYFPKGTGDWVQRSDDLFSMLAWVVLVSDDEAAIEKDYDPALRRPVQHARLGGAGQ